MILPRDRLGLVAMKKSIFTSSGWPKNDIIWKSLGCRVVNGVTRGSPAAKTLGTCGPYGFGLGTSLGTPFTTLPPWLFQIMSHYTGHCTGHCTLYWTLEFTVLLKRPLQSNVCCRVQCSVLFCLAASANDHCFLQHFREPERFPPAARGEHRAEWFNQQPMKTVRRNPLAAKVGWVIFPTRVLLKVNCWNLYQVLFCR